ncbi:hypothetical protein SNE40_014637 [Patella caerulea]|uniref:U8 snoRNA-decapping enzyme n=1 Tax=Patella caerulea TaxID=87958 RepID=A0AAN8JHB0_PATCE
MEIEKPTWGWLEPFEKFGQLGDKNSDYKKVLYGDSITKYSTCTHAAHGMIYALDNTKVWDLYESRAAILMQMRFDGVLGFPGGLVDAGENPAAALNREMIEEINIDTSKHYFDDKDHLVSYLHEEKNLVLHFYTKKVNLTEFRNIERRNLEAKEYGIETFGIIRPPLFTMGDNLRGFPAFLSNQFAGNSKEELLLALCATNIMTKDEIDIAVEAMKKHVQSLQ